MDEGVSGVVGAEEGLRGIIHLWRRTKPYWKWFASTRTVFESKVRRAESMQFADRLGLWVGVDVER